MYEIQAKGLRPVTVISLVKLKEGIRRPYILARVWNRNLLHQPPEEDDLDPAYKMIVQLNQVFGALLFEEQPHKEYKRIESSCVIRAHPVGPSDIADSEIKMLWTV